MTLAIHGRQTTPDAPWPVRRRNGFTLIELMLVVAVIAIVAALAAPGLLRARMSANEASAVGSLRTIGSAEATYSSSCGANSYAQSLDDLMRPPAGSPQGFISADLSGNGVIKSGYVVNVAPDLGAADILAPGAACNANASPTVSAYFSEAHPQVIGTTGRESYASDRRGAVFVNASGAPIAPGMVGAVPLN
jgi:type IV pilus assembly protein PilA